MRLILAVLAALLFFAAPARAAGPEVGIADDRVLLNGGAQADQAIAEWKKIGIHNVRIYALWSRIAPASPGGAENWAQLDQAVARVVAAGMKPILTITGPGPLWASRRSARGDARYDPNPKLFGEFAGHLAARYGDRVDRYIIWNEPNLASWLRPQAECARRKCTPVAPHLYRALVQAAYPKVHAADKGAVVLIGAMSSRGSDPRSQNSNERPMYFLRALGCVDTRFKKISSGRCKRYTAVPADGFAFHPHGVLAAPEAKFPHADDISIAELSTLTTALDKLRSLKRIKSARKLNLYIDEFGYQTDPPDVFTGIAPKTQDQWLQRAAYQAWRNPRVKLFSQYLWKDEPRSVKDEFGGWQSGLRFVDGEAKPALKHFATPFVVDSARNRLWGQVRTLDASRVKVQRRIGSGSWRTIATRKTDSQGYWSWKTRLRSASYRFITAKATSATLKQK
jgi:hypothetical protein